jgi:RNA-directed DNA polymerase
MAHQEDTVYVNNTNTATLEDVLDRENLFLALQRVEQNKGCPGIDNLSTAEMKEYLKSNWLEIKAHLLAGSYKPQPVKRINIPKPNGGTRSLGIPTVIDRLIQQAILQKLNPIFDPEFSTNSFGFRIGKSAHQAIKQAHGFQKEGYTIVVDMDLEKFFDRVNHDMLMEKLSRKIKDKRVLKLIRAFLNAGIMENTGYKPSLEGTPQGSPLSPLLSNIMLDSLDKELEKRGHRFCRYADDCNIYVKSKRAGIRVFNSIKDFLEKKLKLSVNLAKSAVDFAWKRKFLGYSFLGIKKPRVRIAKQSLDKFKDKIREITRGHRSQPLTDRIKQLNIYTRGWMNYFQLTDTDSLLQDIDGWIRHRLRMCLFKQWKKPRTRVRNMLKLGLEIEKCKTYACSKGYWCKSILKDSNFTLDKEFFNNNGFIGIHSIWNNLRTLT